MKNELIQDIRHYKGMTQQHFADWLGVSLASIAHVESNHRNISDVLASKIALKFDVTDADFIEYCNRKKQTRNYFFNDAN